MSIFLTYFEDYFYIQFHDVKKSKDLHFIQFFWWLITEYPLCFIGYAVLGFVYKKFLRNMKSNT